MVHRKKSPQFGLVKSSLHSNLTSLALLRTDFCCWFANSFFSLLIDRSNAMSTDIEAGDTSLFNLDINLFIKKSVLRYWQLYCVGSPFDGNVVESAGIFRESNDLTQFPWTHTWKLEMAFPKLEIAAICCWSGQIYSIERAANSLQFSQVLEMSKICKNTETTSQFPIISYSENCTSKNFPIWLYYELFGEIFTNISY